MTTPTLKFNRRFSPAKERSIRMALEQQLVSDKAQARIEGLSPRSIGNRWDGIANDLHLKYGQRERANVAIELVRSRAVEFLMLALCFWLGSVMGDINMIRAPRTLRGPRPPATARRDGQGAPILIDPDTGVLNFPPADTATPWRIAA